MEHEELTRIIIGGAISVHRALGPGFLESVYRNALAHELSKVGLEVHCEKRIQVRYDGALVGDFVADEDHRCVIVFVNDGDSQCLEQRIDLGFVAGDERPTGFGFEFLREVLQSFGSVDGRIDADRDQLHVESARAGFLLHSAKRCGQRWTDRGASREDEIDCDTLAFDQIVVEVELLPVLIENAGMRDSCRTERIIFGFRS